MHTKTTPAYRPSTRAPVDLRQLGRFLASIGSFHPSLIVGSKVNGRLYHYTDLTGVLGIVGKHDLWHTHSLFSNDEEEMKHGMAIVGEVLKKEHKAVKGKEAKLRLKLLELHFNSEPKGAYVCCFCKEDNLLSQWRG